MNPLLTGRSVMLFVVVLTFFALCNSAGAATRYAQSGGSTTGACDSWAAACDLQYAISQAVSGDEIWVKAGTYRPMTNPAPDPAPDPPLPPDRTISFTLKNGVAMYGGFSGTETERGQRSPESNVTILSGDIGIIGDATDNSYHVVACTEVDNSAILDGFIITGGNANGPSQYGSGAGMYNSSSSPTLRNITFINNRAGFDGGGMYNNDSSPTLSNITFINNTAGLQGGGMYNLKSRPVLTNVSFSGNTAGLEGGGIYNLLSSPILTNVTFSGNSSEIEGVGAYNLVCSDSVIATATTLTSSPNPSTYGTSVDFTATVATVNGSQSSSTPTGTVTFTFKDGATTINTGTLNGSGQVTFRTSALAAGNDTVTAVYAGDGSFSGSTSDPLTQTVNKAGTTTAIASHTPNPSTFGQSVMVNFTVTSIAGTPTGNVTVSDGTVNCTATVAAGSCSLMFTGTGTKTLTAAYAGDANFSSSASASVSHAVNKAATTTAIILHRPDPSIFGQPVLARFTVITRTGGTATGNVTVSDGTVSCTGTVAAGSCSLTPSSVGSKTLTATYAGDANCIGSVSAGVSHTVNKADQAALALNAGSPLTYSTTETLSTTGGSGTGAVSYQVTAGSCTVSADQLTAHSGMGTCSVTATKAGDTNYNAATASGTVTLQKAGQTITFDTLPIKYYGDADFDPGANADSGLPLSYTSSNPSVASIVGSMIHIAGAGTTTITASQSGDDNYNPASDVAQTLYVYLVPGNALSFDGADDYVSVGGAPAWQLQSPAFTLEAWIKPKSAGVQSIFQNGLCGAPCPTISLTIGPESACYSAGTPGKINFLIVKGPDVFLVSQTSDLDVGEWQHVAVTYDGAQLKLYINGLLENTVAVPGVISDNSSYGYLGMDPDEFDLCGGKRFQYAGSMDEIRLWNMARTEVEIQDNMSVMLNPASEPNLTAYYHFDQGIPNRDNADNAGETTLYDSISEANDGALRNFALTGPTSNWVESGAFLPLLKTSAVTSITATGATSGGTVFPNDVSITERGVCWSTSPDPTTEDSCTHDGTGEGTFASSITNLTKSTTYHVRAFAVNSQGTAYGDDLSFTTNRPPVAVCKDVTAAAGSTCTASVSINNGSSDPDGDSITLTQSPAGPYALGSTTVTLTVTDSNGASNQCTGTVTVNDNTPPTISNVSAAPSELWPPNKKMVDVTINYAGTDNCGQTTCNINRVTCNESISGSDYTIVDAHHVKLRADRLGSGNGRIYTINIICIDGSGKSASQAVKVTVPHDQGKK